MRIPGHTHQELTSSVFAMSCSLGQSMLAFLTWHLAGVVPNLVGIRTRTIVSNWETDGYFHWMNLRLLNRCSLQPSSEVLEILETSLAWRLSAICISIIEVLGIDNGLGLIPPRGWRSWNAFDCLESLGIRAFITTLHGRPFLSTINLANGFH